MRPKKSFCFAYVTRHLNRSGYVCLKYLIDEGLIPEAVIVSSDRPALVLKIFRPLVLLMYQVKCWYYRCRPLRMLLSEELLAIEHDIKVISVDSLKTQTSYKKILDLDLDLLVVAGGWHEKIPLKVLKTPSQGSINIHPSLLPEFRGTSITRWQVLNGVTTSGATVHKMDGEFDSGGIIDQVAINIPNNINPQKLFQIIAEKSGPLLVKVIRSIENGRIISCDLRRTNKIYQKYYKKWRWDSDCLTVDPKEDLLSIGRKIQAATQESYEYPGIALRFNGRKFIVREVEITQAQRSNAKTQGKNDKVYIERGVLHWERASELNSLIITRIQPINPLYFLRRSDLPGKWLDHRSPIVISPSTD